MTTSPLRQLLLVPTLLAMLLAGCSSGPTPQEVAASEAVERRFVGCGALAEDITDTLQRYVDQFAPAATDVDPEATGIPSEDDLAQAAQQFQRRRTALGCQPREFQLQLTLALEQLDGVGALGRAVVAQVRDSVIGAPGPAETVTVAVGDDLQDAVHGADAGATIILEEGEHVIDEPLVLLRAATLIGSGSGTTTIVSEAPGAVVLFLGEEQLTLNDVTVEHRGTAPASVLVASTGSYALDGVTLAGGVADEERSTGWGLVLGGAPDGDITDRVEQVTDTIVMGNAAGGVVVVGGRSPDLLRLTSSENASCGVCYLGDAAGTLDDATLTDNETGLSLAEDSAPQVSGGTIARNTMAGVIADGSSTSTVSGATVEGNGDVGIAITGESTVTIDATMVRDHGEVGVLVEGASRPTLSALTLDGAPIGLLARGTSAATVAGVEVTAATEASVVFADTAGGSIVGGLCTDDVPQLVLIDDTTVEVGDTPCTVLDQR